MQLHPRFVEQGLEAWRIPRRVPVSLVIFRTFAIGYSHGLLITEAITIRPVPDERSAFAVESDVVLVKAAAPDSDQKPSLGEAGREWAGN